MVNIKGLDKAKVLHALWHGSHAQGLSFMGLNPEGFTLSQRICSMSFCMTETVVQVQLKEP